MNTYEELLKRGLGLKELKQLLNTLMEISLANKLPVLDALPRFLKDIENQYDNKLGFQIQINNLKLEKEKLQAEVPEYKWYLQLQGVVGPIIIHLNNSGVTNEDIINVNNLVLAFKNSNFIEDRQVREDGNTMIYNGTISNNEFWKRFIEKLKSLKNLYLAIDQSISISNKLKMQIERLNVQKQEVEKNYLKAVGNLNHVLTEASFSFHLTRHIQQEINKRLMSSTRPNPIMFNLLIVGNKDEEKNKTENNDDK